MQGRRSTAEMIISNNRSYNQNDRIGYLFIPLNLIHRGVILPLLIPLHKTWMTRMNKWNSCVSFKRPQSCQWFNVIDEKKSMEKCFFVFFLFSWGMRRVSVHGKTVHFCYCTSSSDNFFASELSIWHFGWSCCHKHQKLQILLT